MREKQEAEEEFSKIQTHRQTDTHTDTQTDNPGFPDPDDHNTFSQ